MPCHAIQCILILILILHSSSQQSKLTLFFNLSPLDSVRPDDARQNRALHGLTRALINNMVVGVTTGYTKKLKIEGVGYQAASKGKAVELTVGFANRVLLNPPEGVTVAVPDPTTIVVSGADKQKVGQFAAEIRASKPPEPYKGKGVRYENEVVRRKEGKSFSTK